MLADINRHKERARDKESGIDGIMATACGPIENASLCCMRVGEGQRKRESLSIFEAKGRIIFRLQVTYYVAAFPNGIRRIIPGSPGLEKE